VNADYELQISVFSTLLFQQVIGFTVPTFISRGRVRSIVTSMSVCLSLSSSLCLLSVRSRNSKTTNFLCTLPVTLAPPSSGRVAVRYVLPALCMTSYFHIITIWHVICKLIPKWR